MADWYYTSGGRQRGPVSESELKSLVAGGTIRPSDLVWNPSMPQWVPAGQAGALGAAMASAPTPGYSAAPLPAVGVAAAAPAPAPYAALAYAGPDVHAVEFTHQSMEMLRQTRPWALFISIIFFPVGGLCAFATLAMIAALIFGRSGPPSLRWLVAGIVLLSLVYVIPAIYMVRFSSKVARLVRMRRTADLEAALAEMRNVFRVSGILIVAGIALCVLGIGAVLIFAS
ncbi:MAG: hypothetical protein JWP03_4523 [Phycisphaerales bacterium]|nr:hypothetical protein [Phycisphaerales bacterium]